MSSVLDVFAKTYADRTYTHTTLVRHKGTLIAFAMDDRRRIVYAVLDMQPDLKSTPETTSARSPFDVSAWPAGPTELIFPNEIAEVGFGVADQTQVPVFKHGSRVPEKAGTALPPPDESNPPFKADFFLSTTARFSADAPFQVLSDGRYVYVFRQAIAADHADNLQAKNAQGGDILDDRGKPVSLVDSTLLVDRFMLIGAGLKPKMEVRYQRSRSRTRPQSRKDSLGAKDLDGNPFYEPTQELKLVGDLTAGRFTVLLLPTQVAEIQRWQIFAHNPGTGQIDSYNVERSEDGLFNTRGSQVYTCVDHDYVFAVKAGKCVEPGKADPNETCGKPLIPRLVTEGYAESALRTKTSDQLDAERDRELKNNGLEDFKSAGQWSVPSGMNIVIDGGTPVGPKFTQELWIYPTPPTDPIPQALVSGRDDSPDTLGSCRLYHPACPSLWIESGTLIRAGFGDGERWYECVTKPILTPNAWNHLAVTFDGEAYRFYVNGRLRDKVEMCSVYIAGSLQTGAEALKGNAPSDLYIHRIGAATHAFTGTIDEVRVWAFARSARELRSDMNQRLTGLEAGLTGYWRFDEADGAIVTDQTGGANGFINGVARWTAKDASGHEVTIDLPNWEWVASDAPIGEHPGVNRSSFGFAGRTVEAGMAALLYYQQTEVAGGYSGEKKPLKQNARVMLVVPTRVAGEDKAYLAALDFGVSASGRLAQAPDSLDLRTIHADATAANQSINETLDAIARLEAQLPALRGADLARQQARIDALKSPLLRGVEATMNLLHTDPFGLTISGGLLGFAWTNDAPLLFDSATGKIALYFRGTDDQFFVTYYDTLTEHAQYRLTDADGAASVICLARSADLEMDDIVVAVTDSDDDEWCSVSISGAGIEEAWERVPRVPAQFANVLNGLAGDREYIGSGTIETGDNRTKRLSLSGGARRALPTGATLFVGSTRVIAAASVDSGATSIPIDGAAPRASKEKRPVFYVEYDYAANARTTKIPADLYNGSLLVRAGPGVAANGALVNQRVTSGATVTCKWTAAAPGSTLAFDGQSSYAYLDGMKPLSQFDAPRDLTMEAWARPVDVNGMARVMQHRSDHSQYALGLEEKALMSALRLDGATGYVSIPKSAALDFSGAITIEAWIKPEAIDGTRNVVAHGYPHTPFGEVFLRMEGGQYQIGIWRGGNFLAAMSIPAADGQGRDWVHLAGVYDNTSKRWLLYRNGVLGATFDAAMGAFPIDADWGIGANSDPNPAVTDRRLFKGAIDEVRIWKRARTQAEIQADMNRRLGGNETDLVGYWHFENGQAKDFSRNRNDGQARTMPSAALSFNGTSEHADMGTVGLPSGNTPHTIEAWVRVSSLPPTGRSWPLLLGNPATGAHHWLLHPNGEMQIGVWSGGQVRPALPIGRWTHIASAFDGTTLRVYVNGSLAGSAPAAFNLQGVSLTLAQAQLGEKFFAGQMDEVRVWKRARTQAEIQADMNRRLSGDETDLVVYRRFEATTASPVPAYSVFAGVGDLFVRSKAIHPCGNWAHLAAAFDQSFALRFDGQGGYLDCGNDSTLDLGRDLTIEVFVQADGSGSMGLLSKGRFDEGKPDQDVPYALYLTPDRRIGFAFQNVDHQTLTFVSTGSVPARFCTIAVTRKRENKEPREKITDAQGNVIGEKIEAWDMIRFYVDGQPVGESKYASAQPADARVRQPVDVGSHNGPLEIGLGAPFRGAISELRLWNSAREAAQIGKDIKGSEKGLVSWWRFEEAGGGTAFDSKSSNHARIKGRLEWVKDPNPLGSRLALYVNGARAEADVASKDALAATENQFTLGALRKSGITQAVQGELEEVRIWQIARTEEQIQDNLFRRLTGEREDLIAYYTFDPISTDPNTLGDASLRGNHLTIDAASYVLSTAPIGEDTPQVRSALAGVKTIFNGLIGSRPAVQEYGDMQTDSRANLIGVFKRCYAFVKDGRWSLITGFKVGDLATEWIGQVQFAPQLKGYIEGAPPVPSENLTTRAVEGIGDVDDYNESSTIELAEAEETTYTYSASRDTGFDMDVSFKLGFMIGTEASVGFGLVVKSVDVENVIGLAGKFEHSLGWLQDASAGAGRTKKRVTSLELRGRFAPPDDPMNLMVGRRFVPDNVGLALVESETADVFAVRLKHSGALIAYQMRPNPDIPKDWNIITFPINPRYTKQGTLDGKIGLIPDADYPHALDHSPDSSYFKPIEAYALKERLNRQATDLEVYFEQYDAEARGRRQHATHFTREDLIAGRMLEQLPHLHKRSLVNTYVWTADGGLFAETEEALDVQSEAIGGAYSFKGMAGLYTDLTLALFGIGAKFEMDALFGGHMQLEVKKAREAKNSFGLSADLDKVDRDLYLRGDDLSVVLDADGKPRKLAGKVDAYRFLSFYLEPQPDHFDLFFNRVVDPIWLEQSGDPNAVALREARQEAKKPPCWRVMHRVTYVSRVLPDFDVAAPSSLEKTLRTLDIDSNYELIKMLDPFVADRLTSFADFAVAVDEALKVYVPELIPHAPAIKQFMSLYYGIGDGQAGPSDEDRFGEASLAERAPNQPPIVSAGADQTIGLDAAAATADLNGTAIDDRLTKAEAIFVTWEPIPADADVTFDDRHTLSAKATFTQRGRYTLRLTADDGMLTADDTLAIVVNQRPIVSAGPDQSVKPRSAARLMGELSGDENKKRRGWLNARMIGRDDLYAARLIGEVIDDGLGDPTTRDRVVSVKWSVVRGSGSVTWENDAALDTLAAFERSGHYLLRLTVSNGTFEATDEIMVAVAARVTDQLLALYTFEENVGVIVHDVSGATAPLDLNAAQEGAIRWTSGALSVQAPTILTADGESGRIADAVKTAGEITIEAWIRPGASPEAGLARIITMSGGMGQRNFSVGQTGDRYHFGLRTTTTDTYAINKALAGGVVKANQLTHLVCTREKTGLARMYVDGVEVAERLVGGDFSGWDSGFALALGNEAGATDGADRAWRGTYHLVALYGRALTVDEVMQNYRFGADADLPPIVHAGPDAVIDWADGTPVTTKLKGDVRHDRPTAKPSIRWTQVGGPDGVMFASETDPHSEVTFPQHGRYALRLTADDGHLMSSDEVVIVVNRPPQVEMLPDAAMKLSLTGEAIAVTLSAKVTDAGLGSAEEPAALTFNWKRASGPRSLQITNADKPDATLRFTERGDYALDLSVGNGHASTTVPVSIVVNMRPKVSAGKDQIVSLPAGDGAAPAMTVAPQGKATDTGLGRAGDTLEFTWETVCAPPVAAVTFSDPTQPDATATFVAGGAYTLRLTARNRDDAALSASGEVNITVNRPPVVDAGPNQIVNLPAAAELDGTVSDDGLPDPPGVVTLKWSKASGAGRVSIADDAAAYTTARFSDKGVYILRLTASDGKDSAGDDIEILVNKAPSVDAGKDMSVAAGSSVALQGRIKDDGLGDPARGQVIARWSTDSGPTDPIFDDVDNPQSRVTFPARGAYTLRLTADNSYLASGDEVTIMANERPVIDAGPDQAVTRKTMQLAGVIIDGGLGDPKRGTLSTSWEMASGPADAVFEDHNDPQTSVTLPKKGVYVLKMTVDNGALSASDEVRITYQ